jgi:glutaredoxin
MTLSIRAFCGWLLGAALSCAIVLAPVALAAPAAGASSPAAAGQLEVFVRDGCPHCADAKRFLAELARERPGLQIEFRAVDADAGARDALVAHSRAAGVWPPGVPTFVFAGRVMVGFDDAEHAGRELVDMLDRGGGPKDEVRSAWFGSLSATRLGLPLFTLALGLLDGFNPCAMWVLLFLLSLLVRLHDRRRMALVAGTFVLASGAVYFAFMAAWLNVFLAVGMGDAVRWALGGLALLIGALNVKDFVAWGRGPSLAIPESAKPGLYARMRGVMQAHSLPASMLGVAVLAVVVNTFELLCTAGIPAVYTAVLARQPLGSAAHYAYLGLYILGYIADDVLMVTLAVLALGSGKLTERAGRWLKFVSGVVMLVLGAVLLMAPQWLS